MKFEILLLIRRGLHYARMKPNANYAPSIKGTPTTDEPLRKLSVSRSFFIAAYSIRTRNVPYFVIRHNSKLYLCGQKGLPKWEYKHHLRHVLRQSYIAILIQLTVDADRVRIRNKPIDIETRIVVEILEVSSISNPHYFIKCNRCAAPHLTQLSHTQSEF